eukprot:TRINITY_DN3841_c0_g1_i1.p1 TRINITY_DN3841_c0_g1~~TRINITY_DN3841_c0_g1_i1.p1  ORF type:complete len:334 (+),score=47.57 TRINITY_DN3841_c0_g1_i1:90-1091(+)
MGNAAGGGGGGGGGAGAPAPPPPAASPPPQQHGPDGKRLAVCDLAGKWRPVRASEWKNNAIGSHRIRAGMSGTYTEYRADGSGEGRTGDLQMKYSNVYCLSPGNYSATCVNIMLPGLPATDGNLTILPDGTLDVRYPVFGIQEFWKREDGRALEHLGTAKAEWERGGGARRGGGASRQIKLVFRNILPGKISKAFGAPWHWGLAVGDSIYEVAGSMTILGPRGLVYGTGPPIFSVAVCGVKWSQFVGYVETFHGRTRTSNVTDAEIEAFCKEWVDRHPTYALLGPNCQTFSEDLFTFLTGENRVPELAKFMDLQKGPEKHPDVKWLDESARPK